MIPQLISAGASLLGGFLNRGAQQDANAANAAQAARNEAAQREFAQNSIQWRAADAAKAGIHPVFAMGAPGVSFSPVSVGATAETGVGSGLQSMGQDISRSVAAYRPPADKAAGIMTAQQTASNALDLETKQLNNTLLKAKIAAMGPGVPPGAEFPVPEKSKSEERPPLMAGGSRWLTNPNTSPAKAWEDQYGDDGPASWLINTGILANDAIYNARNRKPTNRDAARPNLDELGGTVARWYQAAKQRYWERR